jgi:hypothetical protein
MTTGPFYVIGVQPSTVNCKLSPVAQSGNARRLMLGTVRAGLQLSSLRRCVPMVGGLVKKDLAWRTTNL